MTDVEVLVDLSQLPSSDELLGAWRDAADLLRDYDFFRLAGLFGTALEHRQLDFALASATQLSSSFDSHNMFLFSKGPLSPVACAPEGQKR